MHFPVHRQVCRLPLTEHPQSCRLRKKEKTCPRPNPRLRGPRNSAGLKRVPLCTATWSLNGLSDRQKQVCLSVRNRSELLSVRNRSVLPFYWNFGGTAGFTIFPYHSHSTYRPVCRPIENHKYLRFAMGFLTLGGNLLRVNRFLAICVCVTQTEIGSLVVLAEFSKSS